MRDLRPSIEKAVQHFWQVRAGQASIQGTRTGRRDQGARRAATGGKQMAGFEQLVASLLVEHAGIAEESIIFRKRLELPGYFRPEKRWDLLVIVEGNLLASIEFKSQVGPSFGNNYNNRTEEAIGNATDLWTAYREGAFKLSQRPWLGYLFLLEDTPKSMTPVKTCEPHFPVLAEFQGTSYAQRYTLLLTKLVRERLYDSACLLMSDAKEGRRCGAYSEPSRELGFRQFATSLLATANAFGDKL
jgi:hypothetical protein